MKRLANKLKKIFPDHQWITVALNDCGHRVIITSFPIDDADDRPVFDEHRMGYEDMCHPKLQQFMDDNDLRCELQNSESLTLYKL